MQFASFAERHLHGEHIAYFGGSKTGGKMGGKVGGPHYGTPLTWRARPLFKEGNKQQQQIVAIQLAHVVMGIYLAQEHVRDVGAKGLKKITSQHSVGRQFGEKISKLKIKTKILSLNSEH